MKPGIRYAVLLFLLPLAACVFPHITFSPTSLTFPPQVISPAGGTSAAETITVKNTGNESGTIGPFSTSASYSETNNCPSTLAAGASCTVDVTFAPNAAGSINGELFNGGSAVARFSGIGLAPVGFSTASLDFGTVTIGMLSAAQTVTLTNNQSTALKINSIVPSGNYSQSNNCPNSLAAGASCTFSVKFQPTVNGTVPGALTVSTDASPDAQPVGLTGIGAGSVTSQVGFSAPNLSFGNQEAGISGSSQTVTVSNINSSSSLTITSVVVSGNYATTDTCAGKMIPPNGNCTITATFQPSVDFVSISYPGAITVADSDITSPQVVGLSGTGVAPVSASSASLDFGTVFASGTSGPQTLTLTNNHSAAEDISISAPSPYQLNNNACNNNVPAGGKCSVDVTLNSNGPFGAVDGAVNVDFSSGGFLNPQSFNLLGCLSELALAPQSFNFGAEPVGQTSSKQTATFYGGPVNFSGLSISGTNAADFAIANNTCNGTLASGSSCTVDLAFTPAAAGSRSATLNIADDQHCSPQPVSLRGGSSSGPFVLTGSVVGNGGGYGNITSSPMGLDCGGGTPCSGSFASGTAVTLTAAPDSISSFGAWGGACSGTGSCNLTMNADRQVTATFNALPPAPDFSLGISPSTTPTLAPGASTIFNVDVSGQNGFNSSVALACSSPAAQDIHCSLSPTSVMPDSSSTLTVTTQGPFAAMMPLSGMPHTRPVYALWLPLLGLPLLGIGSAGLRSRKHRLSLPLFAALLLVVLALEAGCGGGISSQAKTGGTPAGTYTVIINATSGTLQHSSMVNITVQ